MVYCRWKKSTTPATTNMTMMWIVVVVVFFTVQGVVCQNNDVFNYNHGNIVEGSTTSRGQEDWDEISCGNTDICTGYPNKFPAVQMNSSFYDWEIDDMGNNCKWCPKDSENRNCGIHRQSPIDLQRMVGEHTGEFHKECHDWHWMQYKDDTCTWERMKSQFEINRQALQIWIPVKDNGKIDCWEQGKGRRYPRLDYSKGFPHWWYLQRTDISVPSQHMQEGTKYAAEVTLAHFYQIAHWKNQIGYVTMFMQDYPDEPSWPYLDKLICQWREKEEETRAKFNLTAAPPYGRCRIFTERGQVPTPEWLEEAGVSVSESPSTAPSKGPTAGPTSFPTISPTTNAPSSQAPTTGPSFVPTTSEPSLRPSGAPSLTTNAPSTQAPTTNAPSTQTPTSDAPSTQSPTTVVPSTQIPAATLFPSDYPSAIPTTANLTEQDEDAPSPAAFPTRFRPWNEDPTPTVAPSTSPVPSDNATSTDAPSAAPVTTTTPSTRQPTDAPVTLSPSRQPTDAPVTTSPSRQPTGAPVTPSPSSSPSLSPSTNSPSMAPVETNSPTTLSPSHAPVSAPSSSPSDPAEPPPINCDGVSVPGGYSRMCFSSSPCCEAVRSDTNYCWDIYENYFEGTAIESACWHCCPGKLIGPEKPAHSVYPKSIQCSDSDYNVQRFCKSGGCCDSGAESSGYCVQEFAILEERVQTEICHYCCAEFYDFDSESRKLTKEDLHHSDSLAFEEDDDKTGEEDDGSVIMYAEGRMFRIEKADLEPAEEDPEEYIYRIYDEYQSRRRRTQHVIHEENYEDVPYWPYEWLLHVDTEYYFRYEGTQTVPPCREVVHWRVMKDPLRVHPRQIAELNRLTAWRVNPSTGLSETAGVLSPDGNSVDVSRDVQYRHKAHRDSFCECKDWPSKFQSDKDWCHDWENDVNFDRFYVNPYNFPGGWLPEEN